MSLRQAIFMGLRRFGAVGLLQWLRRSRKEVTILTFHRVSNAPAQLWPPMVVQEFDHLLQLLVRYTTVIALDELRHVQRYPDRPLVILTFDDGYVDFILNALPLLQHYRLPVVHSICPGLIDANDLPWTQWVNLYLKQHAGSRLQLAGLVFDIPGTPVEHDFLRILTAMYGMSAETRAATMETLRSTVERDAALRLMTWDEIRRCAAAGVRFVSHSMSHEHLPTVTDDVQLQREFTMSRQRITDELGGTPDTFVYPSGFYDRRTLQCARSAAYSRVLVCDEQPFSFDLVKSEAFSVWPRVTVTHQSADEEYLRVLGFHQGVRRLTRLHSRHL